MKREFSTYWCLLGVIHGVTGSRTAKFQITNHAYAILHAVPYAPSTTTLEILEVSVFPATLKN